MRGIPSSRPWRSTGRGCSGTWPTTPGWCRRCWAGPPASAAGPCRGAPAPSPASSSRPAPSARPGRWAWSPMSSSARSCGRRRGSRWPRGASLGSRRAPTTSCCLCCHRPRCWSRSCSPSPASTPPSCASSPDAAALPEPTAAASRGRGGHTWLRRGESKERHKWQTVTMAAFIVTATRGVRYHGDPIRLRRRRPAVWPDPG